MKSVHSFTFANDYNFGAQWPNGRFFLPINKTFEGICLALAEKFLQKELWILFVFKIILYKRLLNLFLSLFMNKFEFANKKHFFTGFIDKFRSKRLSSTS